jgi:hypothetical protein
MATLVPLKSRKNGVKAAARKRHTNMTLLGLCLPIPEISRSKTIDGYGIVKRTKHFTKVCLNASKGCVMEKRVHKVRNAVFMRDKRHS